MKAIVWGAAGQDGYYLTELLLKQGFEVVGISRSGKHSFVDITDFDAVSNLVKDVQPDYIFHLAANSTTAHKAWRENHDVISTGALHILEAVRVHSVHCKVFLSGSGLQFKNEGNPVKESDPFDATSIYAVARIQNVYLARYYRSFGMKVYMGYFFNHDSPIRTERHINMKIINAAKRIAAGSDEKLTIGDMSVRKEFGFAGDIMEGVWTLVSQDEITEAVIGTGISHSIQEWIQICFTMHDLDWTQHVIGGDNFTAEYKVLVSQPTTIQSLGWTAQTTILQLAKMMN